MGNNDIHSAGINGWVVICLTALGLVGLVCIVLVFLFEEHVEHSVVFAGILTTLIATVTGSVLTVVGLKKLTANTNSKMDLLVEQTKQLAYAAGRLAGAADEQRKAHPAEETKP